jgi:hypothetical protein
MSALILAAACGAPINHDGAGNTNLNANRSPDNAPAITEADAIAIEKGIWEASKNKDYAAFEGMLADGSLEIFPEGVMDKANTVAGAKQFAPTELSFSDWKFLPIDKNLFAVVYTVGVKGKFMGQDVPLQSSRASAAWVNRGGKWLSVFHQECPIMPPAPPPATKGEPPKPTSPAASPAAPPATGPDPIANEKIVWDLFRSRNYDAFAAILAPDFLEVEPDGVYNREEAIKVAHFDASKVVLSDWRSADFDENAGLVTYTVKDPVPGFPPLGQRHSSIWVKRDGKWLGQLHMGGTPVRQLPPPPPPTPAAKASVK